MAQHLSTALANVDTRGKTALIAYFTPKQNSRLAYETQAKQSVKLEDTEDNEKLGIQLKSSISF